MKKNQQYKSILLLLFLGFLWITFNQSGIIKLIKLNQEKHILIDEVEILTSVTSKMEQKSLG